MKEASKYILYTRKSTESEDKQIQSIEDQVKAMTDYARQHDLKIVETFKESHSAKSPNQRPEFTKMLAMLQNNEADGILCWQLNRLSRNPTESGVLQQALQDETLLCIQTHERIYRPDDNALIFSVEAGMSNQFVRDLRKNVRRGMHSKAEKGWFPGVPPIGYKNHYDELSGQKVIAPDPERYALVRQIWDMMLSGTYTVPQVTRQAEKWGLKSIVRKQSGGRALSLSGMHTVLKNPFYCGFIRYGGKTHPGKQEAMVTQDEFDRVQRLMQRTDAARPYVKQEVDPFPYRGLVHCGECGCLVTYTKKIRHYKNGNEQEFEYCYCTRRRKAYDCSQRSTVSPQKLTEQIREELEKYTIIPEFFELAVKYLNEYNDQEIEKQEAVYDAQAKAIKDVEKAIRGLQRMLYTGRCDDAYFDTENAKMEQELVVLRKKFNEQQENNKDWRKRAHQFFNFARYAKEDFESDSDEKKRLVLADLGQNLRLMNGRLVFEPIIYLVPIVEARKKMEAELAHVGTLPEQRKKAALDDLSSHWYTRTDSNRRPLGSKPSTLSS